MKKYLVSIILSDGGEIQAKAVAESSAQAVAKAVASVARLADAEGINDFLKDADISRIDVSEAEESPSEIQDVVIQRLPGDNDFYVASDSSGMSVTFYRGRFNETAEVLPQPGAEKLGAVAIASEIRRIGDWLARNAKELL